VIAVIKIINQSHKSIGILKLYPNRKGWIRHFEFILCGFKPIRILYLNPTSKPALECVQIKAAQEK